MQKILEILHYHNCNFSSPTAEVKKVIFVDGAKNQ